jgi:hypothetical protein
MKSKKSKKIKVVEKTRKKRTTIKDAYNEGYTSGLRECREVLISFTMDLIDKMIEEYNTDIQRYPRNTRFVELQLDAITDFRERLKYDEIDILSRYDALQGQRKTQRSPEKI